MALVLRVAAYIFPAFAPILLTISSVLSTAAKVVGVAMAFQGGGLKGGLISAFMSFSPVSDVGGYVGNVVMSGLASVAMGGKFKQGAVGALKSMAINFIVQKIGEGFASRQTGGKMANGSSTVTFSGAQRTEVEEHRVRGTLSGREDPKFGDLENNYPQGGPYDVMDEIGGRVAQNSARNGGAWENTCSIRLSRSLNLSGDPVPAIPGETVTGGDGGQYIYRVKTMERYLASRFGDPVVREMQPGGMIDTSPFMGKKGVISFDFGDSARGQAFTGHVDLWKGTGCVGSCSGYMYQSTRVRFWEMKD